MEDEPIGFGMGRIPMWDRRNWMMAPYLDPLAAYPLATYHTVARILNQGSSPSCVGHGGRHDLEATPVPVPFMVGPDAMTIYNQCQRIDGIPLPHDGTTLQALTRYLQSAGFWSSYVWAGSIEDVIRWVLAKGPVVIGVSWLAGMMTPDSRAVIRATGGVVGGHCVAVTGYDQVSGYFRIAQSWGTSWGPQHGKAWLFVQDLRRLLFEMGGECAAPLEPGMV